ncbi:hypothetical protein CFP65_5850 [Kitasatospora sp. MMS16-BH015]|uniref:hypothetical protein n=1 Tax=Kitasatospora sp. MMS16-BH015 TaxID=2018025 RepID=UPI000CA3D464|nr:hypothetical protein [Kitasatospora sp. MMS16-BH015]AUG80531.1 hypothetical protein CFP65_5850 [Kitasatospora sp. MMS16-BH015]
MDVFACAGCGVELSAPVARVALPVHTYHGGWEELHPPLMEPGTYAVEPLPTGPPWRVWAEVGAEEAARQGVYAPEYSVSFGARGQIVIAPGDSRAMRLIPEKCGGYCMGVDGRDGPNLACVGCGRAVATRVDDCGSWQTVWLEPAAVVRRDSGRSAVVPDWADLAKPEHRVPPVELDGSWSRRWEAAVAVMAAHLVAATDGHPVVLPVGPVADLFGHAVARCLPPGPDARSVGLAGPGLGVPQARPDVLLVPRHPLTGEPWRPTGDERAVVAPLDSGVWAYFAGPGETSPIPATGGLPAGVLRDDYPVRSRPWYPLEPHHNAFRHTMVRLPAIRSPRLRRYFD